MPILYSTVQYCTVLYCTVLYCTVLYCTVLYCPVLYCTVLYCTVLYLPGSDYLVPVTSGHQAGQLQVEVSLQSHVQQHGTRQYSTVQQHGTIQYSTVQYNNTVQDSTVQYSTTTRYNTVRSYLILVLFSYSLSILIKRSLCNSLFVSQDFTLPLSLTMQLRVCQALIMLRMNAAAP